MSNMARNAKVSFSSKVEYRAVIRYLYLKGKTGQEIHCELTNVFGSSAPLYAQVNFWVGEFKHSRTSLEDETRSGSPSDATDEEMCNKVRDLVYSDRRIKVEEIANALHILYGSVSTTLHDRLGLHKLTAPPFFFLTRPRNINAYSKFGLKALLFTQVIVRKRKYGHALGQITPLKFDKICPLAIPNQISLMSMHKAGSLSLTHSSAATTTSSLDRNLVKIPCYLLKLSSGNENMGVS